MPEIQIVTVIVQAGFCGVLLAVLWYVGMRLIPQQRAEIKELTDGFTAELKAERAAREQAHEQYEESRQGQAKVTAEQSVILANLTAEVKRLADRTDSHPAYGERGGR